MPRNPQIVSIKAQIAQKQSERDFWYNMKQSHLLLSQIDDDVMFKDFAEKVNASLVNDGILSLEEFNQVLQEMANEFDAFGGDPAQAWAKVNEIAQRLFGDQWDSADNDGNGISDALDATEQFYTDSQEIIKQDLRKVLATQDLFNSHAEAVSDEIRSLTNKLKSIGESIEVEVDIG